LILTNIGDAKQFKMIGNLPFGLVFPPDVLPALKMIIMTVYKYNERFNLWVQSLMESKPASKKIVTLANKLARMTWAVLAKNEDFKIL